jgi:predicted dinucleotide-binding enzyme
VEIAVIGTGFIGGVSGGALARAGHHVTFGSRHPEDTEAGLGAHAV